MDEHGNPVVDIDEQLTLQLQECWRLRQVGLERSAMRLAQEVRRRAQAERRLIPYLHAVFEMMNISQGMLEPEVGRAAALQAISLLESPEQARRFQGDYSEAEYEHTVAWMSACAYDNLAITTALMHGCNSPGMQTVIAEGIQICHRTGKLRCIACFQEYATDVYSAADDLEMALHHARNSVARENPENDRRWTAAKNQCRILLMQGHPAAAWEAGLRAMELAPTYHSSLPAGLETLSLLKTIQHIGGGAGQPLPPIPVSDGQTPAAPPRDEAPNLDLYDDLANIAGAVAAGRPEEAIAKLTYWDRLLTDRRCLHHWFEVRLRLIAAMNWADRSAKIAALANQLEAKARQATDYLTLQRLRLLLEATAVNVRPAPVPPASPYDSGPFAAEPAAASLSQPASAPAAPSSSVRSKQTPSPGRPLMSRIEQILNRLQTAAQESQPLTPFVEELLSIDPASVTHEDDAGQLLYLMNLLLESATSDQAVWTWTKAIGGRFPNAGAVLNLQATIAGNLCSRQDSDLVANPSVEEVSAWFRQSLELLSDGPGCFYRAGQFFLKIADTGEGERCLARSFRLDRANPNVAVLLADLYSHTNRPDDALMVLDLCLREGEPDPAVLWEAAALAIPLGRFQAALTYLDGFAKLVPDQAQTDYYRALTLLGLSRPTEAAQAIEREAARTDASALPVAAVRAAVAAALGQPDVVRRQIQLVLSIALHSVDDLTPHQIGGSIERLWDATVAALDPNDTLRHQLTDHLVMTAMAPASLFEMLRSRQGEKANDLSHYVCLLHQPLDQRWAQWPGRLIDQDHWQEYQIRYGVLATSENDAARMALQIQRRCYPLPATVQSVERDGDGYSDFPGVTWQTLPESAQQGDAEGPG